MLKKIKINTDEVVYSLRNNISELAKRVSSMEILIQERDQEIISLSNRVLKKNNKELRNA